VTTTVTARRGFWGRFFCTVCGNQLNRAEDGSHVCPKCSVTYRLWSELGGMTALMSTEPYETLPEQRVATVDWPVAVSATSWAAEDGIQSLYCRLGHRPVLIAEINPAKVVGHCAVCRRCRRTYRWDHTHQVLRTWLYPGALYDATVSDKLA
jgi:hypothetical protein